MSHRGGDPRLGYRRHGTHTDARSHFDYPASDRQRPFGQEESNRHVPNRNAKYYDMESNYRSRLSKDRHSSKDQESQDFESAAGSNHGSTRFPFASPSEMHKQSGEGATYGKLNAAKTMSVEDEDMFLYGTETGSSSVYLKDYQHGQKEMQETSADDDGNNLSISEAGAVGKQDYDPTIENILKSIGFNIDLSQVVTEPAPKTEAAVERKRAAAVQASESSMMVSEALGISTLRAGFSKKIDSILPAQETYESRARRYREEQTRLYAEANASSDLVKATAPKLTQAGSARSSLEFLQSSYDYDAVVKEFAKEIEGKEVQQDNWAENEREANNSERTVDSAATNKGKRALYEDFSDSDDSEKSAQTETRKVVDHFEAESQRPVAPSPRSHDETDGKGRLASGKASRIRTIEPGHRNSNVERAERTSKGLREPEAAERTQRQVKIIPSTAASEAGSGRNSSGSVRHVVGSRWDSPKRDGPTDSETGDRNVVDPTVTEKRQSKIQSLHKELDRLKQEQKEVMRRKQRGRLGHKDPELLDNCRHQANIISQLNRLLKCTDEEFLELEGREAKKSPSTDRKVVVASVRRKLESSALNSETGGIKSETKSDVGQKERPKLSKMVIHYDYFDDGGHWCRSCNALFNTIEELCQHLQSSKHYENLDLNHRPWASKDATVKKGCKGVPVPIKGVEFLMPSQAFYCSLCSIFSGDAECAYDHLKSNEHNESYQKFLENDTTYEHHYNLDKEAAMSGKMQLLNNKKDPKTEKFGSSTKRPSFSRPSNENTKRTKLSTEFSESKSLNDDSSSTYMQDVKPDMAPADRKVSNALLNSDRRGSKAKDSAPSRAVPQKKPAFIGKLPCLGAKNRSSISRLAKTNGVDDKESNDRSDAKQALLHAVTTSQVEDDVGESQNVVQSSKLCTSEDDLTAMKTSCPVAVRDSQEQDDRISSAIGQQLAAIKSSQSSLELSMSQEERTTTEPKKNADSSGVQEVMSIGDFEIFDECDAE